MSEYNAAVDDSPPDSQASRGSHLLAQADLCVKCGLCLPACPTYRLTRDEGDSPRGRIALIQALVAGALPAGARLRAHLDGCLACRACEAVCPSKVPYGRLIDGVRAELRAVRPPGALAAFLGRLAADGPVSRPMAYRLLLQSLRISQSYGVLRRARSLLRPRLPGLARLLAYAPTLPNPTGWQTRYPAPGSERGRVALFLGCVARDIDQMTLRAAVRVLNRLGYTVEVPSGQGCCGALPLHGGLAAEARRMVAKNLRAFEPLADLPIITTASGCGATLAEYDRTEGLAPQDRELAVALSGRVLDISTFLARIPWPEEFRLRPLPERIVVHEPCSLRNVLRQTQAPYTILRRIPGTEVLPLPGNGSCCGSAGTYMLTHAATADALAREKRTAFAALNARILVSSNIGCALHLGADPAPESVVLHPVALLARQLEE